MKKIITVTIITFLFIIKYEPVVAWNIPFPTTSTTWSTTFDCSEGEQSYSPPGYTKMVCEGLTIDMTGNQECHDGGWPGGGYGSPDPGATAVSSSILTSSNNSSGGGGYGFKKAYGYYYFDGSNLVTDHSSGPRINFETPVPEFYIRWYYRYESGTNAVADSMDVKKIYLHGPSLPADRYIAAVNYPYGDNGIRLYVQNGVGQGYGFDGYGWQYVYSGNTADGNWHSIEMRFKANTSGQSNGTFAVWHDGVSIGENNGVNYGDTTFSGFDLIHNHKANGFADEDHCTTYEIDDLAISTSYIGPYSGTPLSNVSVSAIDGAASEEGPGTGTFRITRNGSSGNLNVVYTVSGTATSVSDYNALSSPATITDGNTYVDVTVTPVDDATQDEGDETVVLTISSDAAYSIVSGQGTATVIIADNDGQAPPPIEIVTEDFDDALAAPWYDNTSPSLVFDSDRGDNVYEARFSPGATTPDGGGASRIIFSETTHIWVQYYVKFSSNWTGDPLGDHHAMQFLTNVDVSAQNPYYGPANSHLTTYLESKSPLVITGTIQDIRNVDQNQIGIDLTANATGWGVAGCNGNPTNAGTGVTCYDTGIGYHANGRWWDTGNVITLNTWHLVRHIIELNTITGGTVNEDGRWSIYVDDMVTPKINHTNIVFRTADNPSMAWNNLLLAPYLSGTNTQGVDQVFWIDDLIVGTDSGDVTPPTNSGHSPAKNATGVAVDTDITQVCADGGDGVVKANIVMSVEGAKHCCSGETCAGGTADLTCTGSTAAWTITKSSNSFSNSQVVNIETDCTDGTNAMATDIWSFTTVAATPAPSGTAVGGGSDSATGGGTGTIVGPTP